MWLRIFELKLDKIFGLMMEADGFEEHRLDVD
jgi:hypothetical protein